MDFDGQEDLIEADRQTRKKLLYEIYLLSRGRLKVPVSLSKAGAKCGLSKLESQYGWKMLADEGQHRAQTRCIESTFMILLRSFIFQIKRFMIFTCISRGRI